MLDQNMCQHEVMIQVWIDPFDKDDKDKCFNFYYCPCPAK